MSRSRSSPPRDDVAVLDAIRYTVGGPCVASVTSTLTLPIVADGMVTGSVNLYATTRDAFEGRHEQIARIFGAWAPGAVTNADLSFRTRTVAQRAPLVLLEQVQLQVAQELLMKDQDLDVESARARLHDAALV